MNGDACEENILKAIYIDLSWVYWFPYVVIN